MNYIEVCVEITPLEIGREIVVAELAEIGFESFVDIDNGVKAYVKEDEYNESLMREISILKNENPVVSGKDGLRALKVAEIIIDKIEKSKVELN